MGVNANIAVPALHVRAATTRAAKMTAAATATLPMANPAMAPALSAVDDGDVGLRRLLHVAPLQIWPLTATTALDAMTGVPPAARSAEMAELSAVVSSATENSDTDTTRAVT